METRYYEAAKDIDRTCIHPWHVGTDGWPVCRGNDICKGVTVSCGEGSARCHRHGPDGRTLVAPTGPAYVIRPTYGWPRNPAYVILWTGDPGARRLADFAPGLFDSIAEAQEHARSLGYAIDLEAGE